MPALTNTAFANAFVADLQTAGIITSGQAAALAPLLIALLPQWNDGTVSRTAVCAALASQIDGTNLWLNQLVDWANGTPTGGDGAGNYPFTDKYGVTHTLACPAKSLALGIGAGSFLSLSAGSTAATGLDWTRTGDAAKSLEWGFDGAGRKLYINRFNISTGAYIETVLQAGQDGSLQFTGSAGVAVTNGMQAATLNAVKSANPVINWTATTNGADAKKWDTLVDSSGTFALRAVNDAYSFASTALSIDRSGTTLGAWALAGTSFAFTGGLSTAAAAYLSWASNTVLRSSADGIMRMAEHTETDFIDIGAFHNSGSPVAGITAGSTILNFDLNVPTLRVKSVAGSEWARFKNGFVGLNTTTQNGWGGNAVLESVATGGALLSALSGYVPGSTVGAALLTRIDNTSAFLSMYYYGASNVGTVTTNGTATSFNTTSDERLKVFGEDYSATTALALIRADPVRNFTWNEHTAEAGRAAVGWSAQKSHALSSDLASPGQGEPGAPNFRPWGVDQGKRTPYLWAALGGAGGVLDQLDELRAAQADLRNEVLALKTAA